jgi:dTDP-4-amino-4,6-dideoxygalactose transaminase
MEAEIPLLDPKRQYKRIGKEIERAVLSVLVSGRYVLGPVVEAFERDVAEYCRVEYAVGCASGTDALLLALTAIGVEKGDEVITTPYTFFSTASTVYRIGAVPVFCDIDPETYNIDPNLIEAKVTERTKAILPVHLFGQTAEMDPILEIAKKHNLFVIEDAAQALGAKYKKKMAGALGDVGCFSFFPTKNLGGYGDGGMVITNNPEIAKKVKMLRVHGASPKYYHKTVGYNSRLDPIQAAALSVKLRYLNEWNRERRRKADNYNRLLSSLREITLPKSISHCFHIYNQYTICAKDRDGLRQHLKNKGIETEIYYPLPLHLQECFGYLGYREGDLPEAERCAEESLAIPVYPELTEDEQERIAEEITNFYKGKNER